MEHSYAIKKLSPHKFAVSKTSGDGKHVSYEVARMPNSDIWVCTCPSFTYRNVCKHLAMVGHYKEQALSYDDAKSRVRELIAILKQLTPHIYCCGDLRLKRPTIKYVALVLPLRAYDSVIELLQKSDVAFETKPVDVPEPLHADRLLKILTLWYHGLCVDVWFVAPKQLGVALLYATGPRAFLDALKRVAQQRGLTLRRFGLYSNTEKIKLLATKTEHDVFRKLRLSYKSPAVRRRYETA